MANRKFETGSVNVAMQLNSAALRFNVALEDPHGLRKVFENAYIAYHGRTAFEHSAAQQRIESDLADFQEKNELPFYVLRV